MAVVFLAKGSFGLSLEPNRMVIYGDIVEGVVRNGMSVRIPYNGSARLVREIESVGFLDNISEEESHVALVLRPEADPNEEARLLADLNLIDELLEITESDCSE